jgi:hypothetical protein
MTLKRDKSKKLSKLLFGINNDGCAVVEDVS